ncbi:hypothetical protein AZO1586I_891 [Bathymodiolus thermophilus thioautotrophic gill symbiont]|uniref:Transposase n=1 Tax=Bathymodiolus thermophilus thioautotrophic gill symbiont TaxID=2360 RepID=A0ABM8M8J6_9GAMM|nr:hypothetical protein AZO1586I_891 [Bathymodiolus thermophilus thioautotrophic gill symbiont]
MGKDFSLRKIYPLPFQKAIYIIYADLIKLRVFLYFYGCKT